MTNNNVTASETTPTAEIGLDTLNEYILELPLAQGVSRAEVEQLIRADPETAEIVEEMRADFAEVIALRKGRVFAPGVWLAARHRGKVSDNPRLQRSWDSILSQDESMQHRVDALRGLIAFFQPMGALALAATLLIMFFTGSAVGRNSGIQSVLSDPMYADAGSKYTQGGGEVQNAATLSDAIAQVFAPKDDNLPIIIAELEKQRSVHPADRAVHEKLSELYDRLLKLPPQKFELNAEDVVLYRNKWNDTVNWLRANPNPVVESRP